MRALAAALATDVPHGRFGGGAAVHHALAIVGPRIDLFELTGNPGALTDELLDHIAAQGGHEAALTCTEYRYAVEARMPGWAGTRR